MARHVVSTQVSCPQCQQPAECTHVADGNRCSTSWSCPHCGLQQEADGRELSDEARAAFYAVEGRWRGVVRDFEVRQVEVLRILRTLRPDPPTELMKMLREGIPVVEGALVEVEPWPIRSRKSAPASRCSPLDELTRRCTLLHRARLGRTSRDYSTMNWSNIVLETLAATPVGRLLETKPALVFSRIARGGGATDWHYCRDATMLEPLAVRLRPGSVVSFYFDERVRRAPRSPELVAEIERIIAATGDAVVGVLEEDGIDIKSKLAVSAMDLQEVLSELPPGDVFYGATPARDNDGTHAVTVTLPDADGIVRSHPH